MFLNSYQQPDQRFDLASGDGVNGFESKTAVGSVPAGQWHLVTAAVNRTNATAQFFLDGASLATGVVVAGFPTYADLNLGRLTNGGAWFHGTMDEARIQQGVASPNWVWADYMTVAQNSGFQSYSSVTNSQVTLNYQIANGKLVLSWPNGTLLQAPAVTGPWTTNSVTSPSTNALTGSKQFYRVKVR